MTGTTDNTVALVVGLVAIVLAAVNMVGGFVVTDRMLQMFTRKKPARRSDDGDEAGAADADLGPARLPGLRGLLHPRPQGALRAEDRPDRQPDRRRGRGASACVVPFFYLDLEARAADPGRDRGRHRRRRGRRPAGADDPDAADGGAVQRRRRRRGRAGRAARARRDRSTRGGHAGWFALAATAFTIVVGSVSFAGSVVTFAKLQELMTSRPVVFPGLPVAVRAARWPRRLVLVASLVVTDPTMWVGVVLGLVGLLLGVLLVLPVGGADVPIVISLLNAFTGLTVAAGGYVLGNTCCWWPARWSAPPARS